MYRPVRGFTLVELIIVIVVVGILASLAAPSFVQFVDNRRLSGAAEAAKNAMQTARSEAFKRSAVVCMSVEPNAAAGTPWLMVELLELDGNCSGDCTTEPVGAGCLQRIAAGQFPGVSASLSGGFADNGDAIAARFEPVRGTVANFIEDGIALGTVELESARKSRLDVRLNRVGRALICAPNTAQGVTTLGYGACD